jgi:glycerophosphoryl diester phosphodiesterase
MQKRCFWLLISMVSIAPMYTNTPKVLDLQGHRGCRALMPENTWPAMQKALELGVATLEMDVVFTADMVCILSHEPFFNHEISTAPANGLITAENERLHNIYAMPYAKVQQYDVGLKVHPRFLQQTKMAVTKPRLDSILLAANQWATMHQKPLPAFNIETKTTLLGDGIYHPKPAIFVAELMKVIEQTGVTNQVTIQSFDIRTLQYLRSHYPKIKTALLIEEFDQRSLQQQINDLGFTPDVYSPHFSKVTQNLMQDCHTHQMKVIPWTVNQLTTMKQLIQLGVDGLISDDPNLYKQL